MARSTYKTYLMKGSGTSTVTYTKLVDIKSFPNLGAAPEQIDVTTLDDVMRRYVEGVQETEAMDFTANYSSADFDTIKALAGTEQKLAVWFGATTTSGVNTPTGSDGKFSFTGFVSVYVNGAGVNEPTDMTITVTPTSIINKESA